MDLRIVRESQGLDVLVSIPLMPFYILLKALNQRAVEPFGLLVRLAVVGGFKIVLHSQQGVYCAETSAANWGPLSGGTKRGAS